MNLKDFTYGLIVLIIPLILIILLYRFYVFHICHNNKECIKNKLVFDINNINNKIKNIKSYQKNDNEEQIEGFFGGLSDWLYNKVGGGSTVNNMQLPSNNQSQEQNTNNLNPVPELNSKFPTENIQDSSNQELINSINKKKEDIKNSINQKMENNNLQKLKNIKSNIKNELNSNEPIQKTQPTQQNIKSEKSENNENNEKIQKTKKIELPKMNLFKECNFYSDKCPSGFNDFGSIGLSGLDKNVMLSCGNVENTKPAKAIAKIKNHSLDEIIILDKGHGYNPDKPPTITIVGGKGNGGHAEAIIDDDGYLKLIKIIHPGNYYTETPNVIIEPPYMNSNCHFCCKTN